MTTVNQPLDFEKLLIPDDVRNIRRDYPSLLEAFRAQQVIINQLIIRVGGSGPGTSIPDLDELGEEVDALSDAVAMQEQDALLASISGRISDIEQRQLAVEAEFSRDTSAFDAIEELRREAPIDRYQELLSRIEALEAQL